jgi:predicted nucleic acid-binding protein
VSTLTGVLDANSIIGLAKGDVFDLLPSLYAQLYVPPAVTEEVVGGGQGLAGEPELTQALGRWITEVTPDPLRVQQLPRMLSLADREVIAVAQEKTVDHLLSADRQLCREAQNRGIVCLQAADVVVLLKRRGLITEAKAVLDRMRQRGFGIGDARYEAALRAVGEWPAQGSPP